ncbi:MAG: hypothetical protein ABFD17_07300, partial [Anaerolineaceae bacterium]
LDGRSKLSNLYRNANTRIKTFVHRAAKKEKQRLVDYSAGDSAGLMLLHIDWRGSGITPGRQRSISDRLVNVDPPAELYLILYLILTGLAEKPGQV